MTRRVAVTGAGWATPLGGQLDTAWESMVKGRTGIGPIRLFDCAHFPIQNAAQVNDSDLVLGKDESLLLQHPRQTRFVFHAATQAFENAGLHQAPPQPPRFGISLGCGETFADLKFLSRSIGAGLSHGRFESDVFSELWSNLEKNDPALRYDPHEASVLLAARLQAQGPVTNLITACTSSTQAIGHAMDVIRRGEADVMIAGGAHTMVHPSGLSGLQRLGVLTESCERGAQAMRPFDRDRDGFVAGEAGATIVLEEYEHARRRGADIWTELVGYAAAHDAYRPTDTHPEARGLVQCIQRVLQQAQIDPADITYISTHGTSTQLNDRIETFAIKRAFGHEAYHIPCSSVKSMVGHSTTACGAVEAVVCAMVLRTGEIAPTINYETPDPDCDLDYVPNIAREYRGDYVLSNNLGFGGQNAVLLFRRV